MRTSVGIHVWQFHVYLSANSRILDIPYRNCDKRWFSGIEFLDQSSTAALLIPRNSFELLFFHTRSLLRSRSRCQSAVIFAYFSQRGLWIFFLEQMFRRLKRFGLWNVPTWWYKRLFEYVVPRSDFGINFSPNVSFVFFLFSLRCTKMNDYSSISYLFFFSITLSLLTGLFRF